jgi:hypothetical protein
MASDAFVRPEAARRGCEGGGGGGAARVLPAERGRCVLAFAGVGSRSTRALGERLADWGREALAISGVLGLAAATRARVTAGDAGLEIAGALSQADTAPAELGRACRVRTEIASRHREATIDSTYMPMHAPLGKVHSQFVNA